MQKIEFQVFLSAEILTQWFVQYFMLFSPFRWFKKGSCPFLAKECAHIQANHLED